MLLLNFDLSAPFTMDARFFLNVFAGLGEFDLDLPRLVPQLEQKFAFSGKSNLHLLHADSSHSSSSLSFLRVIGVATTCTRFSVSASNAQ